VIKLYAFSISELNWPLYFRAASRRRLINRGFSMSEKLSYLTWRRGKSHIQFDVTTMSVKLRIWSGDVICVNDVLRSVYTLIPLQFTEHRTIWNKSHYKRTPSTVTYWNVNVKFKSSWLRNAWNLCAEENNTTWFDDN